MLTFTAGCTHTVEPLLLLKHNDYRDILLFHLHCFHMSNNFIQHHKSHVKCAAIQEIYMHFCGGNKNCCQRIGQDSLKNLAQIKIQLNRDNYALELMHQCHYWSLSLLFIAISSTAVVPAIFLHTVPLKVPITDFFDFHKENPICFILKNIIKLNICRR